ncbi:MAG: glycerol kinase GlpK [Bacillota bacterium]|nr:glycerol kinase GlpK [Bacillota bacterium]
MEKYIMAFDSGTSSVRTIIFDQQGQVKAVAQKEFTQFYPQPGWVEQDPNEIWSMQIGTAVEAVNKLGISGEDIAAIGITNQRETTIIWDKYTGEPVYNAIVWQCRRTASFCDQLKAQGYEKFFRDKTGLEIDAYFSATKIKWILDNVPGARARAERGDLLFGTVDSFLIWKMTEKKIHVTDYSNASRTMLYNINDLDWDQEILELLNIPRQILPQVRPSSELYGYLSKRFLGSQIPIAAAIGDQQAALFGQACYEPGQAKNTYGTGAFLLMNTGQEPIKSKQGLVTTIAWGLDGKVTYALEGSIFVAGSAIKWLRDKLRIIDTSEDTDYMATRVADTNDCYVVPAFTGLGAPYWDQYARGAILGLSQGVNKYHIVRATLESIAYLSYDILKAMEEDSQIKLKSLRVDGGASNNNFLMGFQADLINRPVERPFCVETTALGAAKLAGLAVGYYDDLKKLEENFAIERNFIPSMEEDLRQEKIKKWHKAVKKSQSWAE